MVATADVPDRVTRLCSGSHHRKQELVKELQRNGVNFDVRKLNVGDFLWVAREKVSPVPGNSNVWEPNECVTVEEQSSEKRQVEKKVTVQPHSPSPGQLRAPAGRELVLDYIIERKRMDDLCGSIIDGRFREQKVRAEREAAAAGFFSVSLDWPRSNIPSETETP